MTTTLEKPMAKKRNDVSVRLDADVARKAKAIASLREITLAEFLSDTLRPIVDREWAKERDRFDRPKK